MVLGLTAQTIQMRAAEIGFAISGIARAQPHADSAKFHRWVAAGNAGEMRYLTDYRADRRNDPRTLLPSAKSVVCLGMLYNGPEPKSTEFDEPGRAWISRYAWGDDYHEFLRAKVNLLLRNLLLTEHFEHKVCIDTAPLLERSYARQAGLGWIGKNTCLINQASGSWYLLAEILTSLDLEAGEPAADRCGSCTRCIQACPTDALSQNGLDARLCISYLTIELKTAIPPELRGPMSNHVFGCDICQDVCPWNRKAPFTTEAAFAPRHFAPPLTQLAGITEPQFREMFHSTPVARAKYAGFMRNVCVAMGNQPLPQFRGPLEALSKSGNLLIAEHALWALERINASSST